MAEKLRYLSSFQPGAVTNATAQPRRRRRRRRRGKKKKKKVCQQ